MLWVRLCYAADNGDGVGDDDKKGVMVMMALRVKMVVTMETCLQTLFTPLTPLRIT